MGSTPALASRELRDMYKVCNREVRYVIQDSVTSYQWGKLNMIKERERERMIY